MTKRNPHFSNLKANYLFPEINLRKKEFLAKHPDAHLISLGVGDTTQPISTYITAALNEAATRLGTKEGYTGYGPEQGKEELRQKIADKLYQHRVKKDEIFISDGAKCDLGRLQLLFGGDITIALQDPSYPVYIEGSLIQGVQKMIWMPCNPENDFFPEIKDMEKVDLIYFCSPNNPTGAAATKEQLKNLVSFAKYHHSIIIFDSAYAAYIQDSTIPRSIYEIEGAREVAIEIGSFSKMAGFTGIRLGWSIVPEELEYEGGGSVKADWKRVISTLFNGASNIAQSGGCAVLEKEGLEEVKKMVLFYLENTLILKKAMLDLGYEIYGGKHAPYLWVRFPKKDSWESFQYFLDNFQIITTPGLGFGPAGNNFLRLSAFGQRDEITKAIERLKK